ncbi:hypothetical protein J6590_005379 [Homalodisca vitripennis]|nr:hypothetical protein J6590_005379 [Homalodisca vitripennis]
MTNTLIQSGPEVDYYFLSPDDRVNMNHPGPHALTRHLTYYYPNSQWWGELSNLQ